MLLVRWLSHFISTSHSTSSRGWVTSWLMTSSRMTSRTYRSLRWLRWLRSAINPWYRISLTGRFKVVLTTTTWFIAIPVLLLLLHWRLLAVLISWMSAWWLLLLPGFLLALVSIIWRPILCWPLLRGWGRSRCRRPLLLHNALENRWRLSTL